jgi:hypothetical protein
LIERRRGAVIKYAAEKQNAGIASVCNDTKYADEIRLSCDERYDGRAPTGMLPTARIKNTQIVAKKRSRSIEGTPNVWALSCAKQANR